MGTAAYRSHDSRRFGAVIRRRGGSYFDWKRCNAGVSTSGSVVQALVQHGIGFEIMRTDAACRTYNVLSSEARRIVAAFFI